jgi:hypothetical protein
MKEKRVLRSVLHPCTTVGPSAAVLTWQPSGENDRCYAQLAQCPITSKA